MTAVAIAPPKPGAWEPRALVEAILNLLPRSRSDARVPRVPDPPQELQALVDVARDALGARDLRDLHARLDGGVMGLREWLLALQKSSSGLSTDELDDIDDMPEEPSEESILARSLGMNVARKFARALKNLAPVFRVFGEIREEANAPRRALALRALSVVPWSLHDGQVVPHVLVESACIQGRGLLAMGALIAACVDARRPEPWLTNALADAFLALVDELVLLLASAGYPVDPLPSELLDLGSLFREAEEADVAFVQAFEAEVRAKDAYAEAK